ncbi:hypothetical protein P8452_43982 [Trifolium repens]|nr:hypothetical protein P8452_43982 [Trifolium repens]
MCHFKWAFQKDTWVMHLPIGELAHDFKYHVADLVRERINILIDEWDKVGSDDRKEIWKGLRELWDIPKNDAVEKKTMVYAETWKTFVKSREDPSFLKEGTESFAREKYDGG